MKHSVSGKLTAFSREASRSILPRIFGWWSEPTILSSASMSIGRPCERSAVIRLPSGYSLTRRFSERPARKNSACNHPSRHPDASRTVDNGSRIRSMVCSKNESQSVIRVSAMKATGSSARNRCQTTATSPSRDSPSRTFIFRASQRAQRKLPAPRLVTEWRRFW